MNICNDFESRCIILINNFQVPSSGYFLFYFNVEFKDRLSLFLIFKIFEVCYFYYFLLFYDVTLDRAMVNRCLNKA